VPAKCALCAGDTEKPQPVSVYAGGKFAYRAYWCDACGKAYAKAAAAWTEKWARERREQKP
jgi:predicted amidophosphoribosyltransferase